jgi:hypothetical protein
MGKRKGGSSNLDARNASAGGPDKAETAANDPSTIETARIDAPEIVPSQSEPLVVPAVDFAASIESPKLQPAPVEERADAPSSAESTAAPPEQVTEDVRPGAAETDDSNAAPSSGRAKRWVPLAASILVAAACGAVAGSVVTAASGRLMSAQAAAPATEDEATRTLQASVARLNADLASLRTAVDVAGRSSLAQLAKLGDRLDHLERAQAEPAAKLAKLSEALERIERRTSPAANSDVTGSIPAAAAVEAPRPADPPVVNGWILRGVYHGVALIQGRYGVIEVEPGDALPGLGRVDTIRRQNGRWVVVTSKGLIVAR